MSRDVPIRVSERAGRRCASSSAPWEPVVGYSRAVRSGSWIAVGGTVGLNADGSYPSTAGEQARRALTIIRAAVAALGGRLEQTVRTRIYVRDMAAWEEIGAVHGEFFGEIRPATTLLEVSRFIDERMLVEIEADVVVA